MSAPLTPPVNARLTPAQKQLLDEVRDAGVLYIKRWSRYYRTIEALHRRGLVSVVEPDYSRNGQDGWAAQPLEPPGGERGEEG